MSQTAQAFDAWLSAYQKYIREGTELLWPTETLVRLFKGSYVPGLDKNYQGKKVLDISSGSGNNLMLLGSLGLKLYATEVKQELCDILKERMGRSGLDLEARRGTNRNLPFGDAEFDFLVSWNVLHYENSEETILQGLKEYARVLKPGGRLFLSTTGPEHKILTGATTLGPHRYQIGRSDDFRKGEVFFYFDTPEAIKDYFSRYFRDVMIGRIHDFLLTETLDYFIVTGIK